MSIITDRVRSTRREVMFSVCPHRGIPTLAGGGYPKVGTYPRDQGRGSWTGSLPTGPGRRVYCFVQKIFFFNFPAR